MEAANMESESEGARSRVSSVAGGGARGVGCGLGRQGEGRAVGIGLCPCRLTGCGPGMACSPRPCQPEPVDHRAGLFLGWAKKWASGRAEAAWPFIVVIDTTSAPSPRRGQGV